MSKKYNINLCVSEREQLEQLSKKGKISARKYKRVQTLLMSEAGYSDVEIATILKVGTATIQRTRKKFVLSGLAETLNEKPLPLVNQKK
jgi:transposase